jgi:hypothetical protein
MLRRTQVNILKLSSQFLLHVLWHSLNVMTFLNFPKSVCENSPWETHTVRNKAHNCKMTSVTGLCLLFFLSSRPCVLLTTEKRTVHPDHDGHCSCSQRPWYHSGTDSSQPTCPFVSNYDNAKALAPWNLSVCVPRFPADIPVLLVWRRGSIKPYGMSYGLYSALEKVMNLWRHIW